MSRPAWVRPASICLAAAIALSSAVFARAEDRESETTLPASGIRYPGGYDPNTVGVVEGRMVAITIPEQGPVSFRLVTSAGAYTVFAAPAWYWHDQKIAIAQDSKVLVKGSKTMGTDGNLYLVAQEITVAGAERPLVLRDRVGKPAWSGRGRRGR